MHLVYVDEIKYDPPEEPFYWLVALAIPEHCLRSIEGALSELAAGIFGKAATAANSEFHATAIVQGKEAFKWIGSSSRFPNPRRSYSERSRRNRRP
ncbi:MAG: hypothetical protein WD802_00045 [Gemmatimonadaceae bacterium]